MGGLDFGQHGFQILRVFAHECFQLSAGHGGEFALAALSGPMAQPGQLHRLPAVKPMADSEAADGKNGRQLGNGMAPGGKQQALAPAAFDGVAARRMKGRQLLFFRRTESNKTHTTNVKTIPPYYLKRGSCGP